MRKTCLCSGPIRSAPRMYRFSVRSELAIAVLSPNDTASQVRRKVRQYVAAGAQCVWVVYPETREVEVWREPARPQIVLQEADLLESPGLLPGFAFRIGDLFA